MLRCVFSLFSFRGCQILLLCQSLWRHIHTRCSLMLLPWLTCCCNNETGQTPTLSYMDAYSGPKCSLQSTELSTGTWTAILWLTAVWFKSRPQLLGHCFNHFNHWIARQLPLSSRRNSFSSFPGMGWCSYFDLKIHTSYDLFLYKDFIDLVTMFGHEQHW